MLIAGIWIIPFLGALVAKAEAPGAPKVARAAAATAAAPPATGVAAADLSLVVPLVKAVVTDDAPGAGNTMQLSADDSPIIVPLVADLIVMYAFDRPQQFEFISTGSCARWASRSTRCRRWPSATCRSACPRSSCMATRRAT